MDFYQILGVDRNATQDDIKQAYRRLATKHHPDKGGNTEVFQNISNAYNTISSVDSRAQYDAMLDQQATQYRFTSDDVFVNIFGSADPFKQFFKHSNSRTYRKNRDLNIKCNITFQQSFIGTTLEANYQLPSGKKQTVLISIPVGIQHGQVIKYQGMGSDIDPALPAGDLNVTILIESSSEFARRGNDLIAILPISPIEAMIGTLKTLELLDDTSVQIRIPPGTQHASEFVTLNKGFKINNGQCGNLIVLAGIKVPTITKVELKEQLEKLHAEISKIN